MQVGMQGPTDAANPSPVSITVASPNFKHGAASVMATIHASYLRLASLVRVPDAVSVDGVRQATIVFSNYDTVVAGPQTTDDASLDPNTES